MAKKLKTLPEAEQMIEEVSDIPTPEKRYVGPAYTHAVMLSGMSYFIDPLRLSEAKIDALIKQYPSVAKYFK